MRNLLGATVSLTLLAATPAVAESTVISPNGSRPSAKGPAQTFTGSVTIDPLYAANEHTTSSGGHVTF